MRSGLGTVVEVEYVEVVRKRRLVRSAVVAGVLAAGASPVHAATDPAPNPVHVDVTADVQDPTSGDVVTYTLRVHNDSATSYSHMDVFQLLPAGFHVTEATPKADLAATGPEWTAEVPAGATAVFSATATAGTVAEADHTTAEHTETVARQRSAPVASTTPNPPNPPNPANPATAVPPPATTTFTTTACARDAAVGPALACGSVKQTLSDALGGADQPTKWKPGLLGLGLFAALAAGFRGYVRKRSTRSAE